MSGVPSLAVRLVSWQNLALALCWVLGIIFLLSAMTKLAHQDEFVLAVQNYEILPLALVRPLSFLFSWLELGVGALLIAGLFTRFVAVAAGLLMLGFLALMAMAVAQGKTIDCGCFTGIIEEMVGPDTILRDLTMLAMLPPIFLSPRHPLSLDAFLYPFRRSLIRNLSILSTFFLVALGLGLASVYFGPALVRSSGGAQAAVVLTPKPAADASGRLDGGWLMGKVDAKVQVVIYSDFQCPGCLAAAGILKALVAESNGKVAVTFHHYPLRKHELAQAAAEAAEAAGEQGRFWAMHDAIFANQSQLTADSFRVLAGRLGLDLAHYDESLASGRPQTRVMEDIAEAQKLGVTYTPYIMVDGKTVTDFESLVREVESKAEIK